LPGTKAWFFVEFNSDIDKCIIFGQDFLNNFMLSDRNINFDLVFRVFSPEIPVLRWVNYMIFRAFTASALLNIMGQ